VCVVRDCNQLQSVGLHVLIRGINVSSFPRRTPAFASLNAAGERRSVRARRPCVSYAGGQSWQDGDKPLSPTGDYLSARFVI